MKKLCLLGLMVSLVWMGCENSEVGEPEPAQEFRVAEPLDTEAALRRQIETITAVSEPMTAEEEQVEPSETLPLAKSPEELEQQCVTALKEVAFCTNEDVFLDLIGEVEGLQEERERDRFLTRVKYWFEPGGVREDCARLLASEEAMSEHSRAMWQQAADGAEQLCPEFGQTLVQANAFRWLAGLWASEAMEEMEEAL